MASDMEDFAQFMQRREAASKAFLHGEFQPLDDISAHVLSATLFGPGGNYIIGADNVNEANAKGASNFKAAITNHFEIFDMEASDGIAYWVGLQRSSVQMHGQDEPVPFNLRVTEIFRREDGAWKLVHRHADPIAAEPKP